MRNNILSKYFKYVLVIAAVLLFPLIASGCWDSKDINEKLIITAIAFDIKEEEIIYYIELAEISKAQGNMGAGKVKFTSIKAHGKTLAEAKKNLNEKLNRQIYFSGVRAVIFTENFANQYLVEYLYRFRADENYRKKIQTVITKDDPEIMFTTIQEKEASVGFAVEGLIESLDESGMSFSRTTMRLIENISSGYTGILMSCVGLKEKEIALTGYSVIDIDKITGFIPVEESKAIVLLKADKPKLTYTVLYNGINFTIEVEIKKRKITASYKDGQIGFDLKCDFDAKVLYGDQKTPYNFEDKANKEVTEILKDMLLKELYDAIERGLVEYKCDYFQFDDEFRIRYPAEFKNMDWKSEFPESIITINVSVVLSTTHMMDYGAVDVK